MSDANTVRKPRQKRSIEKKERILSAASALFCEKGYHKTTTPEIAQRAQVSTGCLYSYFTDKHMIFMEVLDRCMTHFEEATRQFRDGLARPQLDVKDYLRAYVLQMLDLHEQYRAFLLELYALYYTDADIRRSMDDRHRQVEDSVRALLLQHGGMFHLEDPEASARLLYDTIESIVHRITLFQDSVGRDRLLKEGLRMVYRYLGV